MKLQVVSYEFALMLKDTPLNSWQYDGGAYCTKDHTTTRNNPRRELSFEEGKLYNPDVLSHKVYAPYASYVHKWLREEHGMHVIVIPTVASSWTFKTVTVLSKRDDDVIMGIKDVSEVPPYKGVNGFDYRTYEEALEAGLKESFKQIEVEDGN